VTATERCVVSIIVTAHNYAEYLPRCLDSAIDQTYSRDNYEIVVVDDGSTDETPEIIAEYATEHPDLVRPIRLDGKGLPAACNAGIEAAKGTYVVRLDADDYFDENLLTVEVSYLDDNPEIDLVFPDYYTVNEAGEIIDHVRNPKVGEEVKLLDRSPLAAGAMFRRSAWEAIDGYDESFHYQEDYDFWIRFIDDFDVHNVNLPLMYYRRHDSNMTHDIQGHLAARNAVKRKFVDENLSQRLAETEVLCLIPAMAETRFHDPDMPDTGTPLALRELQGRPLLAYTVKEALAANRLDRVHVSTEDDRIAEAARGLGAKVPTRRPEELSKPEVGLEQVVQHHLNYLAETDGYEPDLVVLNQYVSPLKTAGSVDAVVDTWLMFSVDSVISVCETREFLWQPDIYGLSPLFEERLLREQRETLYEETGALYAFPPDVLSQTEKIVGDRIGHVQLDRQNAIHIDSWYEFKNCEFLLSVDNENLSPSYRSEELGGGKS